MLLHIIKSFYVTGLFPYAQKTSNDLRFFDVFTGMERDQWHALV